MLAVTAAGLVTSLGDMVSTCAALRAGMTRAEALDMVLPNPGEEDAAQVRGHSVPDVSGNEDYGRLLALLALALEQALGDQREVLADDATQVVVILPDEDDRGALTGLDLEEEFPPDGPERFIAEQLPVLLEVDFPWKKVRFLRGGHTAAAQALGQARAPLERREAKRVVIAAADSLVEGANVYALLGDGRLRTDTVADGFHPGEAGAAVVLEDIPRERVKEAAPLLLIGPVVFRAGPRPPPEPEDEEEGDDEEEEGEDEAESAGPAPWHPTGTALMEAFQELYAAYRPLGEVGAIVDDFNGESPRTTYFWNNLLPLATKEPVFRELADRPRWLTADGIGEVGAATGLVQLCVAGAAFSRGYAPKPALLLSDISDRGDAALVVAVAPKGR